MNATHFAMLEAVRGILADVPGVRTARLVRPGERVEMALGRYPAVLVEPSGAERLAWPEVPAGTYELAHWRAAVLARAVPGTRAFGALADLAEACRAAVLADAALGGLAEDGPPSARVEDLAPRVGATRAGPPVLTEASPGRATAVEFAGASGHWAETPLGAATFADESLFASGPHIVRSESPARRVVDETFCGLSGTLTVDLGEGPRAIRQHGVLSAASASGLAAAAAAIESYVDGQPYTLVAPDGATFEACRMEAFERVGPPEVGTAWHQAYAITYRQLAR